jgi:ABC-2 type transport system permease protein
MIADIWTIVWKDWKELVLQRGGMRRGWLNILVLLGVFGIFLPLQTGPEWVTSPLVIVSWAWVPIILVTSVIADSFAGERERHTLETLLASRMPDEPILLGKLMAAVGYAWGVTMASLILGLVTVNLAHGHGQILLYPAGVAVGGAIASLLTAALAASVGVLVSLRAPTVRQAQQTLGIITMVIVWVPILGVNVLPREWLSTVGRLARGVDISQALLVAALVLGIVDAGLVAAARARFQRARLILD